MPEVYVAEERIRGVRLWRYVVFVNGQVYDTFDSREPVSWQDQNDVAASYREALAGFPDAADALAGV